MQAGASAFYACNSCLPRESLPSGDYDRRTAIHIAAAEGREEANAALSLGCPDAADDSEKRSYVNRNVSLMPKVVAFLLSHGAVGASDVFCTLLRKMWLPPSLPRAQDAAVLDRAGLSEGLWTLPILCAWRMGPQPMG